MNDMEDFVTFEQSVKLKELGFDLECNHWYHLKEEDILYPSGMYANHNTTKAISAPTLSQSQKWLREVKGIIICVGPRFYKRKRPLRGYDYYLFNKDVGYYPHIESETVYDTYEQALSVGLDKALELLKEESNV